MHGAPRAAPGHAASTSFAPTHKRRVWMGLFVVSRDMNTTRTYERGSW